MSDVLRVLMEARELISDESRWTQQVLARSRFGHPIGPRERGATCWCADGALTRAAGDKDHLAWCAGDALSSQAFLLFGEDDHVDVNDGWGHAPVLRMFDAAIASEQAKSGSPSS